MKTKVIKKITEFLEVLLMIFGFSWRTINRISNKVTKLLNGEIAEQKEVS